MFRPMEKGNAMATGIETLLSDSGMLSKLLGMVDAKTAFGVVKSFNLGITEQDFDALWAKIGPFLSKGQMPSGDVMGAVTSALGGSLGSLGGLGDLASKLKF